jgi:sulfate adenylyltransferase subunit 2
MEYLESESIYILREAAAQFKHLALLFSGGKDSIVLTRLAEKAFRPGRFPFPLVLVDTGHSFPEALEYVRRRASALGERLHVCSVEETIARGRAQDEGSGASRNRLQSIALMDLIREKRFDAVIGGARRDEEKARAKERVFSVRDASGRWDPENQRLEPWHYLNGKIGPEEHMRVFPLGNWTELDIWEYIEREKLEVPSIYFSHTRKCVLRGESLFAWADFIPLAPTDRVVEKTVRCRTVGDMLSTGMFESNASSVSEIIDELRALDWSERGARLDDRVSDTAMEDRKREGYF